MKGDGGSSRSRSRSSSFCGVKASSQGRKGGFLNMGMLAHLSRNGLSLLAGDNGAGPFSVNKRLGDLERACPAVWRVSAHEEAAGSNEGPDLHTLSGDECWRLILELGMQWPAWTGAAAPSQATQVLRKEKKPSGRPLQRSHDFLELIATRALEALAQTPPDLYGKTAQGSRSMLAPKQTTQEVMDSKTAAETPPKVTEPAAQAPSSSLEVLAPRTTSTRPRTAALTIFYDGIVNVCDNIPADKARHIMTFAEKAGVSLSAQALFRSVKCVTPPGPHKLDDFQHSTTSTNSPSDHGNQQLPVGGMMSDLSTSTNLDQEPAAECSNSESPAPATPLPLKFTMMPTSEGSSLRHVTVKPLPNARKNSLARFLDSRKRSRGTASCSSEGGSPKKQALGDHGCCLSELENHQEFYVTGKSPVPSSCQDLGMCANCLTANGQAPTSDAEMDSLTEWHPGPYKL